MAEAEATKRGKGRPKGPDPEKFLLFLSSLKDGPLDQREIRARCPELSRGTVSGYSNGFPSFVEKTPSGYSLTPSGQAELQSRELQRAKNRVMATFERTNRRDQEAKAALLALTEKRNRALKYLEKKADIVSRHPKFKGVQDPVLRARAVDALLEGMLCYACFNPKIVNETGSLEHFLNAWDNEGRTFCKKCGLELSKGGGDISSAFAPPRKRFKRAIKDDKDEGIGSVEPDSEELRKFRERYETKARGS